MPLNKLKESDIRSFGKEYVESLEFWIRNIIDKELREAYGPDYIHAMKNSTDFVFRKEIRDEVDNRLSTEPERYSRPIDACLLETEVKILTKPDLYSAYFKKYFDDDFPLGREMLLHTLGKLIYPRNCLYHANPISTRSLEQIICYTNDVVSAIKNYYKKNNMNKTFNVPKIIRVTDSFGNAFTREQFNPKDMVNASIDLKMENFYLYPGDKLKVEVDIDPTFVRDNYKISWGSAKGIPIMANSNIIELTIEEKHIGEALDLQCTIISNEVWHRDIGRDDLLIIWYKVLPNK